MPRWVEMLGVGYVVLVWMLGEIVRVGFSVLVWMLEER